MTEYRSLCCDAEMEPEVGFCPVCKENAEPIPFEDEDGEPVAMVVDANGIIRDAVVKAAGLGLLAASGGAFVAAMVWG